MLAKTEGGKNLFSFQGKVFGDEKIFHVKKPGGISIIIWNLLPLLFAKRHLSGIAANFKDFLRKHYAVPDL